MKFPPVTIGFSMELSTPEVEKLKSMGGAVIVAGKAVDNTYTFPGSAVTKVFLDHILKHPKKSKATNATTAGSTNIAGLQAMFKTMGIITWFLKTQSYPAYSGPMLDDSTGGGAYDVIDELVSGKRKGTFSERISKKARNEGEAEDVTMEEDVIDPDIAGMEELYFGTDTSKMPKAKPSTPPEIIFGTPTQVPTLPGLCFPYFPELLAGDGNFVSGVIRQYFLECLGDTREAISGGYQALKGGLGTFFSTAPGLVLQHIFIGVKLAIEAQARLFLMYGASGYVGFSLHGWYFSVSIDGYKHRPLPYDELVVKIRSIDEHAVAIGNICMKLMKAKRNDTGKLPGKASVQAKMPLIRDSPRVLADYLKEFRLGDDDKEEIEKISNLLSFPQRFWTFSSENILKAVDLLLANSYPPSTEPLFLRGGILTSDSVPLSVFALFGDQAFSFRTAGGKLTKIPKDKASDTLFKPYKGKNDRTVNPNPTIILQKKTLNLCVEDWNAFMGDHNYYHKVTRDSAFRAVAIGGPKGKEFWYGLIERIGPLTIEAARDIVADTVELGDEVVDDVVDSIADFL